MKIEILGTRCAKCNLLFKRVEEVVKELGIDAELVKIEDMMEIMKRGIMMTPGLAINGEIKTYGRVVSERELKELIEEEMRERNDND